LQELTLNPAAQVESAIHVKMHGMTTNTLAGTLGSPPKAMLIQQLAQSPVLRMAWD
jgi:hypothetical protein